MDTKRFNIYAGSILGAALLFLLLNFFSSLIFFGPEHAGHEEEVLAFAVPVEEPAAGDGEPEAPDWATLVAEADPADGESVFNKCRACHTLEDGEHGVGPSLYGVVGSEIAAAEGFSYSPALTELEGEWTLEKLSAFLENPQGYAPGTKMSFAGIGDVEDRVAVIVFLNQADGSPVELVPEQTAAAEPASDAAEGEAAEGEADTETAAAEEEAVEGETTEAEATEGEADTEAAAAEEEAAEGEAGTETAAAEGEAAEGEEEAAAETGEDAGAYAELLAAADAAEGKKVFRKCQACHTLDEGKHRVGPSLYGVIGSDIGSAEGFNYSDAMKQFEGTWTLESLDAYLEKPNEFMPGNKMTFPGLRDAPDRINVLVYIDESDGERDLPE